MRRVILLVTVILFLAAGAAAQMSTATLTGIVTDPSQASIPGVKVKLTSEGTGVIVTVASNERGEYTIPLLSPGSYRLEAETQGFQTYSRAGLVLEIGRVFRCDVPMVLGQISQVVNVSGAIPMLESENSTISQFIEHKSIVDMPLNGRRVSDLAAIVGGAILVDSNINYPRIQVAGGRADEQGWLLDGGNAQNTAVDNPPQTNFNPPVEAIEEFRILSNNYSAEFGNSSAGVITFSTRSGTNRLRGTLYEYFRNDKLDSRNFFSAQNQKLRWNIFGLAVGGPIRRNRTFFFVSTEFQKHTSGDTQIANVPTQQQRGGDFSQTFNAGGALIRIYDPSTTRPDPANASRTLRDLFPGNIIPASRLDAVGKNLVACFPLPNRPATNLAGANNWGANWSNLTDGKTFTVKIDHLLSTKDRLSGRFVGYIIPGDRTPVFDVAAADPNEHLQLAKNWSTLINETHNFSPTLIDDFRFTWGPRSWTNRSRGVGEGWPTKLGLKGASDLAFPRVTTAGFVAMGSTAQDVHQEPINDTNIVNHVSWFRGAHSVKFGGDTRLGRNVYQQNNNISGTLGFGQNPTALPGTGGTGNGIASLLLGVPDSGSVRAPDRLDWRSQYFGLFLQDDWKVRRNVTINLGLRWEAHKPRTEANNHQNGFDLTAINPVSKTPGVVTFAGVNGAPATAFDGDYNDFSPRVGLAWQPFGNRKTVIRSGYGIFYGPPWPQVNTSAGFESSGTWSSPDTGITPPFLLSAGFPSTSRETLGPGFGSVPVGALTRFAPEFYQRNRALGYSQQWNFGIQQAVGWHSIVEAAYIASVGHKLPGPNTSINQVRPELMGPGNAQARRPFPQFGNVTMGRPMWGNSTYHSINIKGEKRFSNGLNLLANYTFGKFIDDVASTYEVGDPAGGFQNYYNRRPEKALSGNDIRNRFVWSSVYELPFGQRRHWLQKGKLAEALGGWNVGLIATLRQGSPFGLVTQNNTTNAFTPGAQRVNILRDPALPSSERSIQRWFDTSSAAVAAPPANTFGNAGRTVLIGPGMVNLDASLLKNHRLAERYNLQFRAEAFNALNHANFMDPNGSLGAANFGTINAARPGRVCQLGLKVEF